LTDDDCDGRIDEDALPVFGLCDILDGYDEDCDGRIDENGGRFDNCFLL
jgi:hypothetical protein